MSPEELQSLVNLVEEKLLRDLIRAVEIGEYSSLNSIGWKQKCKYLGIRFLQLFGWFHQVLVCYCCITGSKSSSFHFVHLLHGFGPFGCIISTCYICGYTLLLFHLKVTYCQERKHELHAQEQSGSFVAYVCVRHREDNYEHYFCYDKDHRISSQDTLYFDRTISIKNLKFVSSLMPSLKVLQLDPLDQVYREKGQGLLIMNIYITCSVNGYLLSY